MFRKTAQGADDKNANRTRTQIDRVATIVVLVAVALVAVATLAQSGRETGVASERPADNFSRAATGTTIKHSCAFYDPYARGVAHVRSLIANHRRRIAASYDRTVTEVTGQGVRFGSSMGNRCGPPGTTAFVSTRPSRH